MKFIGITGGIGAGKSSLLSYLAKKRGVRVMLADEIAGHMMERGQPCFEEVSKAFCGEDIFLPQGGFDKEKLAALLFSSEEKREKLNAIVHPAVREYVKKEADRERKTGKLSLLVLEAALLIEEHYDEICDELWYIYAGEEVREARLIASRGYSREKVQRIFASQLSEEEYRKHVDAVIDNSGTIEESAAQLEKLLIQQGVGEAVNE